MMQPPTTIAGYRTLEGRYALLECLVVSGIGNIYRGRDLTQAQSRGMDSRILVHLLPNSLDHVPLESLFQQLTQSTRQLALDWIMPARTYGQDGDTRYIVMDSPIGETVISLARQLHNHNSLLARQLQRQMRPLQRQGYVRQSIDPALVVSSHENSLYLLSTALSPQMQSLQSSAIPLSGKRKTLYMILAGLGFGLLTTLSAVAASYLFEPAPASRVVITTEDPEPATSNVPSIQLATLMPAAPPVTTSPVILPLSNSDQVATSSPVQAVLATPPVADTPEKAGSKVMPVSTEKSSRREPVVKPPATTEKKLSKPAQPSAPVEMPTTEMVEFATESPGILELAQQADAAIQAGNYGKALNLTRQLRDVSRLHPNVKHLGHAIVSHYHQQARAALQAADADSAQQKLATSHGIIREFNLVSFNSAQTVLEHKAASLR